MDIDKNVVSIKVSNVDYTTILKDKQWGIDLKFTRSNQKCSYQRLFLQEQSWSLTPSYRAWC